jgi:hypothetical protein
MADILVAQRSDLIFEGTPALDGSGDYTSQWFDTAEVDRIRFAVNFPEEETSGTVTVCEGMYTGNPFPNVIRTQNVPVSSFFGFADLGLTTRYFQFKVTGGLAGGNAWITVRKVSG